MKRLDGLMIGAIGLAVLLSACNRPAATDGAAAGKSSTAAPVAAPAPAPASDRTITITAISPDPEKALRAGQIAKIKIETSYVLPPQGGLAGVVIQGPDNQPIKSSLKEVAGGKGTLQTELEFQVPAHTHLMVHAPIYVKGELKSSHVAVKQYSIVK